MVTSFTSHGIAHSTSEGCSVSKATSIGHAAVQSSAIAYPISSVVSSSTVTSKFSSSKTEQGLLELAKALADQVNLSRLPSPEPSIFFR